MAELQGGNTVTIEETKTERGLRRQMAVGEGQVVSDEDLWKIEIKLPRDLSVVDADIDPLILAGGVKEAVDALEVKLVELVQLCRARGHTWTKIGEALAVSKQAAWERFSGEE